MTTTVATYGLTAEDSAILSAPVPAKEIKSYNGRGGKEMRYTSVGFVEGRLRQVDPNFEKEVVASATCVTVHYTVKGVKRGDLFDIQEGGKFGTPATSALASACRRAAKQFGIAQELWEDAEDARPAPASKPAAKSVGLKLKDGRTTGKAKLSDKQIEEFRKRGLTDATIDALRPRDVNSEEYHGINILGKLRDAKASNALASKKVLKANGVQWVDEVEEDDDDYLNDDDDEGYEDDEEE